MSRTRIALLVGTFGILMIVLGWVGSSLNRKAEVQPAPVVVEKALGPTDLTVGVAYQVLQTRLERLQDGRLVRAWYFAGKDRSLRAQYIPMTDGRGRRILRIVTNDPTLPKGHMRIVAVEELDPTLEGLKYGTYRWDGLVVELNPRRSLRRQRYVPEGGPVRR